MCAAFFSSRQGFPTFVGHISSYRCARNFEIVKLNIFSFLSCRIITHILTAFSITFLTHLNKKKWPSTPWFVFSSLHFSPLVHLYRWDLFNSLAISVTEWPEDRQNRCLSVSTNSAGLHFRERVQKIKENGKKKTKIENVQNGQEKYSGEKTRVHAHLGQNFKNVIISSKFSLNMLWKVI